MDLDVIAAHCLSTLPEEWARKLQLLRALYEMMGIHHPLSPKLGLLLEYAAQLEDLQTCLHDEFRVRAGQEASA